jgi:hypothetical protein
MITSMAGKYGQPQRTMKVIRTKGTEFILRLYAGKRACETPKFILSPVFED